MRWFTPVFFTASAVGVWVFNTQVASGEVLAFSFLEPVVGPDPERLGQATVALMALIALGFGISAARSGEASPAE